MDEDIEDLFDRKDLRKKKDKKRSHKHDKEYEEYNKDSFKKMKEEIDEMRKREMNRTKELEELKRIVVEQNINVQEREPEYALQFSRTEYLSKGFIESAKWIKEVVAKNMIEKMNEDGNFERFEIAMLNKKHSTCLGIRTCARYNRGETCNFGKWHSTHKPDVHWPSGSNGVDHQPGTYGAYRLKNGARQANGDNHQSIQDRLGKKNEIRLHSCTLCMEALGSAVGHNVLNCPWILQKNWISKK